MALHNRLLSLVTSTQLINTKYQYEGIDRNSKNHTNNILNQYTIAFSTIDNIGDPSANSISDASYCCVGFAIIKGVVGPIKQYVTCEHTMLVISFLQLIKLPMQLIF